jgi:hypothetical protein
VQAGRLLIGMGYTRVRHYRGGIEGWQAAGGELETTTQAPVSVAARQARPASANGHGLPIRNGIEGWLLDLVENSSTTRLFVIWLLMVIGCGIIYWLDIIVRHRGLTDNGATISGDLHGLLTSIYFSFATATSVGYGDVVPVGAVRFLAVGEAIVALLIFGAVIAKFVSRRQEKLVSEIHQVSFEERLDRVQANLHFVLRDLQEISLSNAQPSPPSRQPLDLRLESTVILFLGELRTVHHLLYHPYRTPDEEVLESILVVVAHSLQALESILRSWPPQARAVSALDGSLATLTKLALEICSDCVPRAYAGGLRNWMDLIHSTADSIASYARMPLGL